MTAKPHMFSKIFDFAYERTGLQGLGFYLCHLIIYILILGLVFGFAMAAGVMQGGQEEQLHLISTISIPVSLAYGLAMTYLMLKAKRLTRSRNHVLIGALAVILGGFGTFFSLMPIAWLSTRPVAHTPVQD